MSHFSKIKTNINNLDNLMKTIHELGLNSKLLDSDNQNDSFFTNKGKKNLVVYNSTDQNHNSHICTFVWNRSHYSVIVDLQLWNIGMDFEYFIELLSQKYAYNMIISHSLLNGFQTVKEQVKDDGSISLTLRRWTNV
uniref:Uncharacterized protein ycf35 n=1 Tax=Polysiphonia scopulorum TaxID=257860 RepID=A0A1Z1MI68_9FLOR|nr:hypothetical protein [Polysiphonia scopulorum]ARW65515.1 hypothetical protein [Polysiphonia scopulorum]